MDDALVLTGHRLAPPWLSGRLSSDQWYQKPACESAELSGNLVGKYRE